MVKGKSEVTPSAKIVVKKTMQFKVHLNLHGWELVSAVHRHSILRKEGREEGHDGEGRKEGDAGRG